MMRRSRAYLIGMGIVVSLLTACASISQNKMEPERYFEGPSLELARAIQQNRLDEVERLALNSAGYLQDFPMALDFIRRGADISIPTKNGGGIALSVQESTPQPGSASYKAQAELKKLLVGRGVKFPIFHPSAKPYASLLDQWHQTQEGRQWQEKLQAIGADPMGFGRVWKEADDAAFAAFKAWMQNNNIPEPDRPKPKSIDLNE